MTKVLKETGHDGKTTNEEAGCHLGGRPEAHVKDVVADIPRLDRTQNGGGAGPGYPRG